MTDVTCSECGSPYPYFANPSLCSTPFCEGRMDDGYVPSRHEAMRNMATVDDMQDAASRPGIIMADETDELTQEQFGAVAKGAQPPDEIDFRPEPRGNPQDVLISLPGDAEARKQVPVMTGVVDYFPAAIAAVAELSKAGNDQHNPGEPLHWARGKSVDHADCILRHLIQRGTRDKDGIRHTAKVAWRALALLQEEIEAEAGFIPGGA